jgi:hypothetical protein
MAVSIIQSSPDFGKSYRRTISLEDYTSYVLVSNIDNIAIPTDFNGNNGVYTDAIVSFRIFLGNDEVTDSFTLVVDNYQNCSITIDNIYKTATITSLTQDIGYFVIKASYNNIYLYNRIFIYKSKAGVDGSGVPDNKTIILDGDSHLKVRNLEYVNNSDITSGVYLYGGLSNSSTGANRPLVISTNNDSTNILRYTNDSIIIGKGNYIRNPINTSSAFNDLIVIGNSNAFLGDNTHLSTGSIVIGSNPGASRRDGYIVANAIAIGKNASNSISNSISLCYPKQNYVHDTILDNQTNFFQDRGGRQSQGSVSLSIPVTTIYGNDFALILADLDIIGFRGFPGDESGFYKQSRRLTYYEGALVLDNINTSENYIDGDFETASVTITPSASFSSGNIVITANTTWVSEPNENTGLFWYVFVRSNIIGG